jgi:hypothetical protein
MVVFIQVENHDEPFWKNQVHVTNEKAQEILIFSFWI